jgi:hypothetical protein
MESNKRETQFEGLLKDVKGKHSKRMNAILATTDDDEEFSVLYFKILEYATPKLQRQELTGSIEVNKVTIERVDIPIEQIETE